MSKLHKSIIIVLFVALAFAALLSPVQTLLNNTASIATDSQAPSAVAYNFPTFNTPDGDATLFGFTWAG